MSLDKAIEHGREKRKPYYKLCYQIDRTCRNHGGNGKKHDGWQCPWCKENRLYQTTKEKMRTDEDLKEEAT